MNEAKEKLKHITKRLCENFKGYFIDGDGPYAPTGETFITYCSVGSKPEGRETKTFFAAEEAVDEFEKTIRDIIKMGKGTLYWRIKPQIVEDDESRRCYVRSRFLISDKPEVPEIMEQYYNERIEKKKRKIEDIFEATVGWG